MRDPPSCSACLGRMVTLPLVIALGNGFRLSFGADGSLSLEAYFHFRWNTVRHQHSQPQHFAVLLLRFPCNYPHVSEHFSSVLASVLAVPSSAPFTSFCFTSKCKLLSTACEPCFAPTHFQRRLAKTTLATPRHSPRQRGKFIPHQ